MTVDTSFIDAFARNADSLHGLDQSSQQRLLGLARGAIAQLEHPAESVSRLALVHPLVYASTRICVDLELFEHLAATGDTPRKSDELAQSTGCDPRLLERLLKQLAVSNVIREVGPDTYVPSPITHFLATPQGRGAIINPYDATMVTCGKLPEYFKQRKYANPTDMHDSAWQYATGSKQLYFEWVFSSEFQTKAFSDYMAMKTLGPKWFASVPVAEILGHPADPAAVLLVDMGGASGVDLIGFHAAFPKMPGRLILQDLPKIIRPLDKEELQPIEAMEHDFFTEQPVRGAKAYYMKMVLDDWDDDECVKILSTLKPALVKDHSKILINEILIPATGASWFEASLDVLIMLVHATRERREQQWRSVIERAGLKITKIWDCGAAFEKLIEVELA